MTDTVTIENTKQTQQMGVKKTDVMQVYFAAQSGMSQSEIRKKFNIDNDTAAYHLTRIGAIPLSANKKTALEMYEKGSSFESIQDATGLNPKTVKSIVSSFGKDRMGLYPAERIRLAIVLSSGLRGQMFYEAINPKLKNVPDDYIEELENLYSVKVAVAKHESKKAA